MARESTKGELMPGARERMKLSQFPKDLIKNLADAGFSGLRIPEKYGGQMAAVLTPGIACEETARPDLALPHSILGEILAGGIVGLCNV